MRRGPGEGAGDDSCGGGDGHDVPGALGSHDGEHGAGDVEWSEEVGLHLCSVLEGGDFFEESGLKVAGVVDQDVDVPEGVDAGLDGLDARGLVGDVERYGEELLVIADRCANTDCVASGGDDGVTGGKGCLCDLGAHTAAGAGDEPDRAVSHVRVLLP